MSDPCRHCRKRDECPPDCVIYAAWKGCDEDDTGVAISPPVLVLTGHAVHDDMPEPLQFECELCEGPTEGYRLCGDCLRTSSQVGGAVRLKDFLEEEVEVFEVVGE